MTLDRAVDIPMGGVICAANRVGNGFLVRGCTFGFNRSRGILIKASHGQVVDNRMEGCRMSAVLVTPEYRWLEAGSSNDVQIINNSIVACRGIAISRRGPGRQRRALPPPEPVRASRSAATT